MFMNIFLVWFGAKNNDGALLHVQGQANGGELVVILAHELVNSYL